MVEIDTSNDAHVACASLPWRRRDDPTAIGVFVINEAGQFVASRVSNGSAIVGEVCFSRDKSTQYAIYFMPFAYSFDGGSGSYHSHFLDPASTPPVLDPDAGGSTPPAAAKLMGFEAYSSFDERSPMELVASSDEIREMQEKSSQAEDPYLP